MTAKYRSPAALAIRRESGVRWMIFALLIAAAILFWVVFTPDEACAWGCAGHICVEDFDCPKDCSCARIPWEPAGECV